MSDSNRKSSERVDSTFSDDIETICSQIGFDPKLYVEFPRENRVPAFLAPGLNRAEPSSGAEEPAAAGPVAGLASSSAPPPAAALKQPPASETTEPVRMPQAVHASWPAPAPAYTPARPAPAPAVQPAFAPAPQPVLPPRSERAPQPLPIARPFEAPAAPLPPVERQVAVQGVRAGLRALLKDLGGDERPAEEQPQRRARSIVVAPAVSGMGCSTLTATLARFYQNRGEGVLIFDDREDGLLRLHFQAADSVAIPIMSRDSAPTLAITWFEEPMARHQMEYRWFLMDTKSITPALVNAPLSPGSCYLVPVLADMRGVKAAVRLSEQLDSYESEQGRRLAFYFVLNQFDRASRLQEEMRQHLMRRLGGRLAPVAIRWAEEVGAALAEGTTVLDYAPESPAAQDFESLGEWLAGLG
jgi:hypothetical protein